ncbi:hypothetical protein SELMODRAFT_405604 [Selaginella moellendorffii]|uniref:Uncharacterized protein n=1 Tax=Selaginella moellendorffii TaxID=88036 RepID=D8QZ41_SELML|nr:hypothetical protein SELMODRAFT_405604 [Selaginella moellendorffii]
MVTNRPDSTIDYILLGFGIAATIPFTIANGVLFVHRQRSYFLAQGGIHFILISSVAGLAWIATVFVNNGHFSTVGPLQSCKLWLFWLQGFCFCFWFMFTAFRLRRMYELSHNVKRWRWEYYAFAGICLVPIVGMSTVAIFSNFNMENGGINRNWQIVRFLVYLPYWLFATVVMWRLQHQQDPLLAAEYMDTFDYLALFIAILVVCLLTVSQVCLVFFPFWTRFAWPVYLCLLRPKEEMDAFEQQLTSAGARALLISQSQRVHFPSSEEAVWEAFVEANEELEKYKDEIQKLEAQKLFLQEKIRDLQDQAKFQDQELVSGGRWVVAAWWAAWAVVARAVVGGAVRCWVGVQWWVGDSVSSKKKWNTVTPREPEIFGVAIHSNETNLTILVSFGATMLYHLYGQKNHKWCFGTHSDSMMFMPQCLDGLVNGAHEKDRLMYNHGILVGDLTFNATVAAPPWQAWNSTKQDAVVENGNRKYKPRFPGMRMVRENIYRLLFPDLFTASENRGYKSVGKVREGMAGQYELRGDRDRVSRHREDHRHSGHSRSRGDQYGDDYEHTRYASSSRSSVRSEGFRPQHSLKRERAGSEEDFSRELKRSLPKGTKSFAPANGCDEILNYYVKPDVSTLAIDLEQGKYCVLTGVRQSGKTTTALYVRRLLEEKFCSIYVSFPRQIVDPQFTDSDRWDMVVEFLRSSGDLEPDPTMTFGSSKFMSMFRKGQGKDDRPVILIFDELNVFSKLSEDFKQSFLATVRNLKQDRHKNRLLSVLAIGTDSLLLELKLARRKRIQGAPPGFYLPSPGGENSPFSDEFRMASTGFTLSDIELLLWQYEKDTFISVDREAIAASMLELTSGHKGLVGACCDLLHREFIDKSTRTLEMWLQLRKDKLIGKIFVKATYYAIISTCKALEPRGKELLLLLLRAGGNVKVPYDETVELLLSEGVVVDTNPDGVLCDLKFSSLLLMSTLLYGLYVRLSHSVEAGPRPPRLDHAWVISRTIERLDRSIFERAESQNEDSLASEYSIQFEMFVKLKAVLLGAYPHQNWIVIPEPKTKDNKRSRLDIFVKDGVRNRWFALELLRQGTLKSLEEHWEKSEMYAKMHSCVVYMLNFILDGRPAVKDFKPSHAKEEVIFYNVWLSSDDAKMVGNYACDGSCSTASQTCLKDLEKQKLQQRRFRCAELHPGQPVTSSAQLVEGMTCQRHAGFTALSRGRATGDKSSSSGSLAGSAWKPEKGSQRPCHSSKEENVVNETLTRSSPGGRESTMAPATSGRSEEVVRLI